MKRFPLSAVCIIISLLSNAQSTHSQDSSKKLPSPDSIYMNVDARAQYRGGISLWMSFLQDHFVYSDKNKKNGVQGTVVVQFIVEANGKVTDIKAIDGPEPLREDAENTIRKTPNWLPALKNGVKVRSYVRQPIIFRLQ